MKQLQVAIIGKHSPHTFSGGRYHSWVLAEALQNTKKVQVDVYSTCIPVFSYSFRLYSEHNKINVVTNEDFTFTPIVKNYEEQHIHYLLHYKAVR